MLKQGSISRLYNLKVLKGFFLNNIIKALLFRELKTRFGANKLGYFWVIGEPMIHIVIMLLMFSYIKDRIMPQVPFSLFLISGLVPFFMFKNIVMKLIDGINANKALFAYRPVKPIHVFIARTFLEAGIYSVVFVVLMFLFGWFLSMPSIPYNFLEVFGAFFVLVLFGFSLGLCLSILVHAVETIKIVINVIFTALYFASAIMYPLWVMPSEYVSILLFNPLTHILEIFRENYFVAYPVTDGINILYPLSLSVVLLYIGLWFYYHRRSALGTSV